MAMRSDPLTPPDRVITSVEERRVAILNVIRSAQDTIALSLFRCNDREIFAELARASARGVRVEALATVRAKGRKAKLRKLWTRLEETGASVHAYSDPVVKYHAKYIVVDDGPAVVASLNFTRKCFERTCDAVVITYDPEVVCGLRALMEADRDERALPDTVSPRLIVGPERARRQLTALLAQAKTSIRIIDAKLSDPDLVALLRERRAAGLTVDTYCSKRLGPFKSHGKMMLIDDSIAVVGGLALAAISLDFRREVAIVLDHPEAVAEIAQLMSTADAAAAAAPPIRASELERVAL
jgi:phosphatidylserine/phosphatidylglycerophosphate/cardiolipin synthase-like enzyme